VGRTEAFKLYHEVKIGESINYYDVTSLYPYINKTGKAVLGHPTVITENFGDISAYEGLIKCKVYPLRNLHIPVLPAKINNKLLFALCKTCAEFQQQTTCLHSDNERAITGTWITDDLKMAIMKGYKIDSIYEVWHFNNVEQYDPKSKTGGVFTEYINTFLEMKQEASGWPSWCIAEIDKQTYIDDYFEKEGIRLDYEKIVKKTWTSSISKADVEQLLG